MKKKPQKPETDNSKYRLLEEALRESETKFRYVVEAAADGIITADGMGKIVSWNGMARKMFGYKDKEVIGKPLTFLMPERYIPGHTKGVKRFIETGKSRVIGTVYEVHGLRKDGSEFPLELSLASWDLGKGRFFAGILRDITERKEAMDRLKEANKNLKETQVRLIQSEKMASISMLVAGIAHEINNPMGALISMQDTSERALEKLKSLISKDIEMSAEIKKIMKVIDDSNEVINLGAERVEMIVKQLKSFARLDEAELQTADIHEGIDQVLSLIHQNMKNRITISKSYGKIPKIRCYPAKLNQLFLNMIMNADQAMPKKGTLTITTYLRKNDVYIEFKDTGIGIPKDNLNRIFDPGYTTKGVSVGTGLGLSICYQIVQEHNGEIKVTSKEGKGTTFKIILPKKMTL
ncbi:MAG: PAS domain S-box protein [Candidatus Marinimicrobia bacterium]|nr:PAS domain S-box protein [Candidatus Neomarinimicrobiota bacterium]TFB11396.1 PAS domain S-box protein [Candidatus Marinimicrobia bacterium MT.SAG.2]